MSEVADATAVASPTAIADPARQLTPEVTDSSRIELVDLSITANDDSFMVGDLAHGEFIEVPQIAVVVINALREGHSVGEAAHIARTHAGADVDVADFVTVLREVGFVTSVDGVALAAGSPELTDGGRAGAVAARLARPLYSAPAMIGYGLLFLACGAALVAVPWLRPSYHQLFFLSNPVLSIALLNLVTMPLLLLHEVAHWLGARVEGIPARITLTRRYYFMVAQTDLSGLWALSPRRRLAPLLAGLAFETVTTAALLACRASQHFGWWHPAPLVSGLISALVLLQIFGISFQFALFLRTDLYGVLITCLGCRNLSRVSRLSMIGLYRRRTTAEESELASADQKDRAVARWYGWVQAGGVVLVGFYFVVFFAPATVYTVRWIGTGLATSSPAAWRFWVVLVSGCVALVPVLIPPVSFLRDRRKRA
jgi:putative peptide zinc metalloprotease protein